MAQQIMAYLYPILATLSFVLFSFNLLFWLKRNKARLVLLVGLLYLNLWVSFSLLAIVTGPNPLFDINEFRNYIVLSRISLGVIMLLLAKQYFYRFLN